MTRFMLTQKLEEGERRHARRIDKEAGGSGTEPCEFRHWTLIVQSQSHIQLERKP